RAFRYRRLIGCKKLFKARAPFQRCAGAFYVGAGKPRLQAKAFKDNLSEEKDGVFLSKKQFFSFLRKKYLKDHNFCQKNKTFFAKTIDFSKRI
ncbi:MAG: hypothetical protein IKM52_02150, partial [Clostridia bacterium]|nr:hypothetical protein [Clostridia bacterium]